VADASISSTSIGAASACTASAYLSASINSSSAAEISVSGLVAAAKSLLLPPGGEIAHQTVRTGRRQNIFRIRGHREAQRRQRLTALDTETAQIFDLIEYSIVQSTLIHKPRLAWEAENP
jgi:hypothetical protein